VGAPLGDPLVLDALERWASAEAADVLGRLFILAAVVLVIAAVPAWLMRGRTAGAATSAAVRGDAPARESSPGDARGDQEDGAAAGF
jgi:hypothetical protein